MQRTISGMVGKGSLTHNNRDFVADNINQNRIKDNITYKNEDLKLIYEELFGAALERYNEKQKRNDRKIGNYYEHIRTGRQEKLFHEVIFQIGNVKDMAVGTPEGETAKTVLNEFMAEFEGRNPHLRVFSAHLHMDEATPHLHIDFVPFTTGSKRGLDTRVSMKKALEAQGFLGGSREDTELNQWINSAKKELAQVMQRHGIEWEQFGTHREHLSVLDHKKQVRSREVKALEASIDKLQQKQVDMQAVEQVAVTNIPLSSKVVIEQKDYNNLLAAAKKYVAQDRKEKRLEKMLKAAEKTIEGLMAKIREMKKELDGYRSVRGQLRVGELETENGELRRQNKLYQSAIERSGADFISSEKNKEIEIVSRG